MTVPLRIVFELATPVCINHPWLHLDGLLAHQALLQQLGRDYYLLETKQVVPLTYETGLARFGDIYCASISIFEPDDMFSLQYFKRFEARGFPAKSKISIARGHYRAWMLRSVYVPAQRITYYACGDPERIEELLSPLTHVGNDNRVGWGKLRRVWLERVDHDHSLVREGVAMRPIPTRLLWRWSDQVPLAVRPPYWAAENVELCAPPGAEVELEPALAQNIQ